MQTRAFNQLLIILISQVQDYPWSAILLNSLGDEKDRDLEEDITIITTNGGQEVNLILNTDDLILNAYPKEETEEKPFISFTLENIKYNLFIGLEHENNNHYFSNNRDNEVQDVIHSLNEDPTKAKQEIVDQVNDIYGNEKLTFFSLQGIQEYFETIHLECQEISLNRGGTVIQKQGIPEL